MKPETAHPLAWLWSSRLSRSSQEKPICVSMLASYADHSNYSYKHGQVCTYHPLLYLRCLLGKSHDPVNF